MEIKEIYEFIGHTYNNGIDDILAIDTGVNTTFLMPTTHPQGNDAFIELFLYMRVKGLVVW